MTFNQVRAYSTNFQCRLSRKYSRKHFLLSKNFILHFPLTSSFHARCSLLLYLRVYIIRYMLHKSVYFQLAITELIAKANNTYFHQVIKEPSINIFRQSIPSIKSLFHV